MKKIHQSLGKGFQKSHRKYDSCGRRISHNRSGHLEINPVRFYARFIKTVLLVHQRIPLLSVAGIGIS